MSDVENKFKPKTRAQIVDELSKMLGQDKKTTRHFMSTYESLLILELSRAKEVKFGDIGKFKVAHRAERKGVNPKTGELVIVPEKTVPKFTFNKGIKEIINHGIVVDGDNVWLQDYEDIDESAEDEFVEEYIELEDDEE